MEYYEIINKQREKLPESIKWWPKYFYHFTNIQNAIGILDKGWIYGRQEADKNNLMKTDNASQSVISVSQNKIQEYARLYFRPRTPTQYNNEGYKPKHIRNSELNANCPVPIFFFLDSIAVLNTPGVEFSATSCAGNHDLNLLSGTEQFENLPFNKIYHDRPFSPAERDDIIKHRHAEVVRQNGIPIKTAIKGIFCRSVAEKQTLLYLLEAQHPHAYKTYQPLIRYSPWLNLFFNNGIFIKTVKYNDEKITIEFNDPTKRYDKSKITSDNVNSKDNFISFKATVHFIDNYGNIISRVSFDELLNYSCISSVNLNIENPVSKIAIIEITFDNNLMYNNILNMETEDLL